MSSRNVVLVGTVPLNSTDEVLRLVGPTLGTRLKRVTDGETGKRSYWVSSQAYLVARHPLLEPAGHNWDPDSGVVPKEGPPKYRLRAGVDPKTFTMPTFGYPEAARESYARFVQLKKEGVIPPAVKFQVTLPTPLAFVTALIDPASQAALGPAFEACVRQELAGVLAAVPHDQLAFQWDVCLEVYVAEGLRKPWFGGDPELGCIERVAQLANAIPPAVELGIHLCYGDFQHKHAVEPKDMGLMVRLANAIASRLTRPLTWLHMPVPRDRSDDAYFIPLKDLRVRGAEIYLGLVHYTDGVPGTARRIATASRHLKDFGIATECGLGRRPPDTIPKLLQIHAAAADGAQV